MRVEEVKLVGIHSSSMAPRKRSGDQPSSSRSKRAQHNQREEEQEEEDEGIPDNPFGIVFRDALQEARFNVLINRRILATRYCDFHCLEALGLNEDVDYMFGNIGWTKFMRFNVATYAKLTLEFLSSLSVNTNSLDGCVRFRLFNEEHEFDLDGFNRLFKLPTKEHRQISENFRPTEFWQSITGETVYIPSRAKATAISNPCFRYVHRVMAHTVFGRGDSDGVVRRSELFFLWAMMNSHKVDTGAFIAKQMEKVSNAPKGDIVIGGLITIITTSLVGLRSSRALYDLPDLPPIEGNTCIDLESCLAMKMIVRRGGVYWLVNKGQLICALPNAQRTTVRDPNNWLLAPEVQIPPLQAPHIAAPSSTSPSTPPPSPPPLTEHDDTEHVASPSNASNPPPPRYMAENFQQLNTRFDTWAQNQQDIRQDISAMRQEFESRLGRFETRLDGMQTMMRQFLFDTWAQEIRQDMASTRQEFDSRLGRFETRLDGMYTMMRQFYDWHVEKGYQGPPPPPSPPPLS